MWLNFYKQFRSCTLLTEVLQHQVIPRQSQHSYNAYVTSGGLKPAAQIVNLQLISLGDSLGSRTEVCR